MQGDPTVWPAILSGVLGILASSGFWAFLMKRADNRKAQDKLLLGLACDRIVHLGMFYIERGEITKDEYEMLHDYLWIPYRDCGGDGTAERVMNEVMKLKIRK